MNLSTNSVTVRFGAVAALQNVSFKVASGERRAVIGPNGAGKTTLFDVITGQRRPTSGRVLLDDADVTVSGGKRMSIDIDKTECIALSIRKRPM